MAQDMQIYRLVVTVVITTSVIAGLDPASHHPKNMPSKVDGYAVQARVGELEEDGGITDHDAA